MHDRLESRVILIDDSNGAMVGSTTVLQFTVLAGKNNTVVRCINYQRTIVYYVGKQMLLYIHI